MARLFRYLAFGLSVAFIATLVNSYFYNQKERLEEALGAIPPRSGPRSPSSILPDAIAGTAAGNSSVSVVTPEFIAWVQEQTAHLDDRVVPEDKEAELAERALHLATAEIDYMVTRFQQSSTPVNERIFISYILSLGGEATHDALLKLASEPLQVESAAPHTTDEIISVQERALRVMAIDAIAKNQSDLQSRIQEIGKIIAATNDSFIKNYALQKQEELKQSL